MAVTPIINAVGIKFLYMLRDETRQVVVVKGENEKQMIAVDCLKV